MTKNIDTAVVVCHSDMDLHRQVTGLTVGERLLLALSFGGVSRVVFVGSGPRPECGRTQLEETTLDALGEQPVLLLPADAVFDRGLIKTGAVGDAHGPLLFVSASELKGLDDTSLLARVRQAEQLSVPGYALRVVDGASAARARKALLLSLIKPIDGFISKNINRKVSLAISSVLVKTPLLPNQLTGFIMVLGVLSGVLAYLAQPIWMLVAAGLLFQTQSMLDGCDGELARLKYRFSTKGQWLDTIGDDLTNYTFCLGLGLGQARVHGLSWLVPVALAVLAVQLYASIIMYQRIYKMGTGDLLAIPNMVTGAPPTGTLGVVARVIHTMTKRDFFVFVTSLLTALGFPLVSFGLIAGGTIIMAPSLTLNEIRIRRALASGQELP